MDAPRSQTFFIISPETNEIIPIQITNPNETFQSTIGVLRTRGTPTNLIYYNGYQALSVDPAWKISDYLPLRRNMVSFWAMGKMDLSAYPILSIKDNQILIFLIAPNLSLIPFLINKQAELKHVRLGLIQNYQLDVSIIKLFGDQREKLEMGKICQHLPVRTEQILFILENNLVEGHSRDIICSNRKSIQGWEIQKYRPSDLIHYQENGQTYCFLKSDVSFLQQGLNPFTGQKIRADALKEFIRLAKEKSLFDPYGVVLPKDIKTKCPLFVSHDPLIRYHYQCDEDPEFVVRSISPGQDSDYLCVGKVYQTTLKRPLSHADINPLFGWVELKKSNIAHTEILLDAKTLEVTRPKADRVLTEISGKTYPVYVSVTDEIEKVSLRGAVKKFMQTSGVVLFNEAINDIIAQKIRPSKPIVVYRGLGWADWNKSTFEKWMNGIGRKKIAMGDQLDLVDVRVSSWSTNICISSMFASSNYGVIFSYQAKPNEIMLDTRMLLDREKFSWRRHDQAEVMLLPGQKKNGEWGGPITRRVKVEMVVWNRGQRTPSGFLLKEKPVKQYNLWVKELIIP